MIGVSLENSNLEQKVLLSWVEYNFTVVGGGETNHKIINIRVGCRCLVEMDYTRILGARILEASDRDCFSDKNDLDKETLINKEAQLQLPHC